MMTIHNRKTIEFIVLLMIVPPLLMGQFSRQYEGPDDPAGDDALFRSGNLDGNDMFFEFHNNSSITDTYAGMSAVWNRWPNNYTGSTLVHGINAVIASRIWIEGDTIPVTDIDEIKTRDDIRSIFWAQQGFRNREDKDPTGTFGWGFKPVYGYLNELGINETPAMSDDPDSWPQQGWPAPDDELKWPAEWNGRYGRGVVKADLEAFFVLNDGQDQENLPANSNNPGPYYYPRPGVKIGDKRPDVTTQRGLPWGGLGLRMEVRPYQWNNPQARDALFYEYLVANISDYTLPEICFGYYCHPYVGQDHGMQGDDYLFFDKTVDMAYNWDMDGIGMGALPTPTFGMAYLESPTSSFDGADNDEDGLIDELRDNHAAELIGPYDGISNLDDFLRFYNYTEDFLHEHWDADEDQDWQDGSDNNGDGKYQITENYGDDVGLDGVGPGELNYTGPDADGTECNHKPDFIEGIGCEPNFGFTDVSESDMLGLTSYHTFDHESEPPIHEDDERYWNNFSNATYDEFTDRPGAWVTLFATGSFPLYQGRTERISMAVVGAYDPTESLNSSDHNAPSLYRKKEVVQIIYESDYRFAQPPHMPTLTATAGDGKVTLTWDDIADTRTREALLKNKNDFEGYKLYKATDPFFQDAEIITDGNGTPIYKRPIFQCDVIDNKLGYADFGLIEGVSYYLGDDTGLQHYFVDTNVQNGRTYYYGIVAYDYGIPELSTGVTPSENNLIIELDQAEKLKTHSRNVAVVTPRQQAAGYTPPGIEFVEQSFSPSLGAVSPSILTPDSLKGNHTYQIAFHVDSMSYLKSVGTAFRYTTNGYSVYDVTDGGKRLVHEKFQDSEVNTNAPPKIMYDEDLDTYAFPIQTEIASDEFEGIQFSFETTYLHGDSAWIDYKSTGWRTGNLDGDVNLQLGVNRANAKNVPWDYEIIWGDPGMYSTVSSRVTKVRDENNQKIDGEFLLEDVEYDFMVIRKSFPDTSGNYEALDLVAWDVDSSGTFDITQDKVIAGFLDSRGSISMCVLYISFVEGSALPRPNDVYRIGFQRALHFEDTYTFKILPEGGLNSEKMAATMDSIQVVPNPYVVTNALEPAVDNYQLEQRRRVMFTHLPARCTIRIFSVSGVLIDEIDVENNSDNGIEKWDLKSREGLEVAAGIYVYHVESKETGEEKIGKLAVVK